MTLGCFAGFEGFDCSIVWILMTVLFFLVAIIRRQIVDTFGYDFSLIGGTIGGELAFFIVILITKSMKFSFLAGIIAAIAVGLLSVNWFSDGGGGDW